MILNHFAGTTVLRLLPAIPLLLGLQTAHAGAPPPQAHAILDVCHDTETGLWRYAGVVSVLAQSKELTAISANAMVQNKVSEAGYADAFSAGGESDLVLAACDTATTLPFDIAGPPLPLGSVRTTSRVSIMFPANPLRLPITVEKVADFSAAVCGCQQPKGCTRTQGYWGNKPGVIWPAPYHGTTLFHASGLTWQQVFDTPPKWGNGYLILAHQTMAALLNRASGASAPSAVQTVINQAVAWFASGVTPQSCGASLCATQRNWAGILDTYNNGRYPNAPKHCP